MRVLGTSVLVFEAIVVLLAIPVAVVVGTVSGPPWVFITAGIALAIMLIALAGVVTRPWAVPVGWVLQVLVLATSILVPVMIIIGGIFAALWWLAIRWGRRVDGLRAQAADGSG
ncbi:MAG: DUF4233 domain-containing protein [Candidatus Nanopelagicales bacterium]